MVLGLALVGVAGAIAVTAIVLGRVGTGEAQAGGSGGGQADTSEPTSWQTLASPDGALELNVPSAWSDQRELLNEEADIGAGNLVAEEYAIVLAELKSDFAADMALDAFCDTTVGTFVEGLSEVESQSEPATVDIGGSQALQREIRGTVDGLRIIWIHTCVETPDRFVQVVAWTLPSKFDKNETVLRDVTASLREV